MPARALRAARAGDRDERDHEPSDERLRVRAVVHGIGCRQPGEHDCERGRPYAAPASVATEAIAAAPSAAAPSTSVEATSGTPFDRSRSNERADAIVAEHGGQMDDGLEHADAHRSGNPRGEHLATHTRRPRPHLTEA